MFPSGGNPFDSSGNSFGGGGFGEEPPMDESFGFLSNEESAMLFEGGMHVGSENHAVGVGLHFCEILKD
jgi:hypothetical protein